MEDHKHLAAAEIGSILLVFCAPSKRQLYINKLPPLGILSLASYLESKGIRTDVIDLQIDDFSRIDPGAYRVIGFSVNVANVESSLACMRRIRRDHPQTRIVVGGPHCKSFPEYFIGMNFIDAVCMDEGEEAFHEYIEGRDSVPGMHIKTGSMETTYPGPRKRIEDLDSLPFPALDKVDLTRYNYYPRRSRPISSLMTSRGCPFGCIFCFQTLGRRWRKRSALSVVSEIEWQVKTLGVREIAVYDDNFSLDRARVLEICDLLMAKGLKVSLQFTNGLRAEHLDEEVLQALKRAGTWLVGVAPDTGTERVMELIEKKADLGQIQDVVRICRKLGIRTFAFFMLGFPGETREEIEKTIAFAKKLDTDMVQFARVLAYKGTKLFEMLDIRNHDHGREMGYFYESRENRALTEYVRRANRTFYLRPRKLLGLLRMHSMKDLVSLGWYSIMTRSI